MGALYDYTKPGKYPGYLRAVLDVVSEEAPYLALVGHGESAPAALAEWPVDMPKRNGSPTAAEGSDKTSGFDAVIPLMLSVYAQRVQSKGWMVTDLAQLTRTAISAQRAEAARQQAKDAKGGLLSVQDMLLGDQDTQPGNGNDNVYKTRAVYSWLSTSEQSSCPVPAGARPTQYFSGTLDQFDEDKLVELLCGAASEVDRDVSLVGFVGPALAIHMANFAARAKAVQGVEQFTRLVSRQDENRLVRKVQFFEYVGGEVKVVVQRRQFVNLANNANTEYTARSGFFVDPSKWELEWLDPWRHFALDDNGGGPRGFHKGWLRHVCKCPLGQFAVKISDGSSSSSSSSSSSESSDSSSSDSSSSGGD